VLELLTPVRGSDFINSACGHRLLLTDRVEEVSHPLGNDECEHDGHAERDVARTFDNNHRQTERHSSGAAKVRRRTNQRVLGYVRTLSFNSTGRQTVINAFSSWL